MPCRFRYVTDDVNDAVTMRLFRSGPRYRAEVLGPIVLRETGEIRPVVDRVMANAADAFDLAIRIANSNDSELVITGDRSLWDPSWGILDNDAPS
jgi:hypothetical protein